MPLRRMFFIIIIFSTSCNKEQYINFNYGNILQNSGKQSKLSDQKPVEVAPELSIKEGNSESKHITAIKDGVLASTNDEYFVAQYYAEKQPQLESKTPIFDSKLKESPVEKLIGKKLLNINSTKRSLIGKGYKGKIILLILLLLLGIGICAGAFFYVLASPLPEFLAIIIGALATFFALVLVSKIFELIETISK